MRPVLGSHALDIAWFRPDGREMDDADWDVAFARTVGVYLNGSSRNP